MSLHEGLDLNLAVERSYNTWLSNSTLLPLLLLSLARQKNSPDTSHSIKHEYDYIVVGAGTAGSVVASRLSEIPCVSVLLLEAGGPPPRINDVPVLGANFWFSNLDWQYRTAPQRHTSRGQRDRQVNWPSGKALGGSSILNNGLHVRGNRRDYDIWESMGAKGWSYEDVLPYFKKLEDNRDPEYVSNGYHGVGGPVTVQRPRYQGEIKGPVFRAAQAMGYKIVDSNAQRQTGFYDYQANQRDSQRCSTAKAYLVPAENRKNLDILPNARVRKVVIENRQATGVLFEFKGRNYEVRAKREVIMSAGAINTAQLLMLSGIGPRRELEKFGIKVLADLPVGRNLMDHGSTTVDFVVSPSITELSRKVMDPKNIKLYIHNRTGPLANAEGVVNMAFLYSDQINPKIDYPNYELYFGEASTGLPLGEWNLKPEVYRQVYGPYENQTLMICFAQQLHPRSRGTVTLQSANPYDEPVIDPNYLDDPRDVEDFVQGMKTCNRIGNSPHLRQIGSRRLETLYPGCERYANNEDRYFRCQARLVLFTLSHPCGTAKMGDPKDPTTVVDPELRVKKIKGLRVVDNSIMPQIVSGNTGVPAIMIGEKASDIIKQSIQCQKQDHKHDYDHKIPGKVASELESEDFDYDKKPIINAAKDYEYDEHVLIDVEAGDNVDGAHGHPSSPGGNNYNHHSGKHILLTSQKDDFKGYYKPEDESSDLHVWNDYRNVSRKVISPHLRKNIHKEHDKVEYEYAINPYSSNSDSGGTQYLETIDGNDRKHAEYEYPQFSMTGNTNFEEDDYAEYIQNAKRNIDEYEYPNLAPVRNSNSKEYENSNNGRSKRKNYDYKNTLVSQVTEAHNSDSPVHGHNIPSFGEGNYDYAEGGPLSTGSRKEFGDWKTEDWEETPGALDSGLRSDFSSGW